MDLVQHRLAVRIPESSCQPGHGRNRQAVGREERRLHGAVLPEEMLRPLPAAGADRRAVGAARDHGLPIRREADRVDAVRSGRKTSARPPSTRQTREEPSALPVTTSSPAGLNATASTWLVCPISSDRRAPVRPFQISPLPSRAPVTTRSPGPKAAAVISASWRSLETTRPVATSQTRATRSRRPSAPASLLSRRWRLAPTRGEGARAPGDRSGSARASRSDLPRSGGDGRRARTRRLPRVRRGRRRVPAPAARRAARSPHGRLVSQRRSSARRD